MDTMKIVPGVYQYTAVDDCTRFRVLGVYKRSNGTNTLDFLSRVVEEMPFPLQRIQTDRARRVCLPSLFKHGLPITASNSAPNPPRSPHLNGKVERSQLTDLQEFWAQHDPRGIQILANPLSTGSLITTGDVLTGPLAGESPWRTARPSVLRHSAQRRGR